jgi:ribonuclease-3
MALVRQAFVHASYANEHPGSSAGDNERLEFLGDAVLNVCISEHLVRSYPEWSEGQLTRVRAAVVCEASLARRAAALGFGKCLRLGKGEENGGGRGKPSILAGAFEALVGAVYLQMGMEGARRFVLDELRPVLDAAVRGDAAGDYKTRLQEVAQRGAHCVDYRVVGEQGPDHQPVFIVCACLDGRELAEGRGGSKKEAEQAAARSALDRLSASGRI